MLQMERKVRPFIINPAEIAPSSLPDKPIRNLKKSSQDHQTSGYPLALFYILELVTDADMGFSPCLIKKPSSYSRSLKYKFLPYKSQQM